MNVDGEPRRTIWLEEAGRVCIIDQNRLPFEFREMSLTSALEAAAAIREMHVRGAGLIGATAAFGIYLAAWQGRFDTIDRFRKRIADGAEIMRETRPTARNLEWAIALMIGALEADASIGTLVDRACDQALSIADGDAEACRSIGRHGVAIIREVAEKRGGKPVRILTHCNAGWLAFVDYGSATAPIYLAHDENIPIHVWVDETRPRNQGARLTAWELDQHGVPNTLIVDNTGGYLMQQGMVDLVLVGADRVTSTGDVANKVGTYLKALAANDTGVPFYVAMPSSTIDWDLDDGVAGIPIEERSADEVIYVTGISEREQETRVRICPDSTVARNFAFDVTPARLVTGLITENGLCQPNKESIYANANPGLQ